jgi:phosphate-selective porin OprO/OprP
LAFVPFRRVGFMAYNSTEDQRLNWAYSVFRTGGFQNAPLGDDRFATDIGDVGGYSFTERTTYLLYYDDAAPDRYLWTIGGSYDFSQISANTGTGNPNPTVPFYQARTTPEFGPLGNSDTSQNFGQSFATNPVYVDTGKYLASSFNIYGAETVAQAGPWGFTSEWMATSVNSTVGPVFYHGAYAQVAYRLTGENRTFDKRTATLGKVIPYTDFFSFTGPRRGIVGWGAWEIAARWSYVSLINPGNLQYLPGSSGVGSGRLDDSTLGLTWFWNAYMKWQFNWIHAELHNMQRGYSVGDLFVTRLHIDF